MKGTFSIYSLGCRVNQTEADSFREMLRHAGLEEVAFGDAANVILVHTCTVTNTADAKSRQAIHKARKDNPTSILVVSGCYVQMGDQNIAQEEPVDILIGTKNRHQLISLIEKKWYGADDVGQIDIVEDISRESLFEDLPLVHTSRTRAFLKIQEGCQQFCTYCIIPFARGPVRSRKPNEIGIEIERLLAEGFQEIVLTGIHLGAYGQDLAETDLSILLQSLKVSGLKRIRLGSLDPIDFSPALKEVLYAGKPLMNHFHIALQSGDDNILSRMNRGYSARDVALLLEDLRRNIPYVSITTDVMVGFPGETNEQHQNSLSFVESLNFSDIHIFKYSPRKNTKAAGFPNQVAEDVKDQRMQDMLFLKHKLKERFARSQIGTTAEVLVEKITDENDCSWAYGYTENYLRTRFLVNNANDLTDQYTRGQVVRVQLVDYSQGLVQAVIGEEE